MLAYPDPLKATHFLNALRAAEKLSFPARPLADVEIRRLEQQRCECEDWSLVRVAEDFRTDRVRNVRFRGRIVLGKLYGWVRRCGFHEAAGIENVTLEDCLIEDGVVIRDVRLISGMKIGHGVLIAGCGEISHQAGSSFGVGFTIPMIETGGRATRSYPEMTFEEAAHSVRPAGNIRGLAAYLRRIDAYAAHCRSRHGIIQPHAILVDTPRIENSFTGSNAEVRAAQRLSECVLLSSHDHPVVVEDGAIIRKSSLQWGSHVASLSIVEGSLLCEYSSVERHGKVFKSIIGPNTTIAEGEVTSSLIGPFVGFHHQALLIGVVWPEGKGNVGYGCNCGSNHTGKAPDQEFWPGEGMFLGLGVNVKFPGCFTGSPYTFIATGVSLPPQRVDVPFSLILDPSDRPDGVPRGTNEIIPGWVLSSNLFAIMRNERKFAARDRAFRTRTDHRILREDTIRLLLATRQSLSELHGKDFYTGEKDWSALGANFMTERSRLRAIETYTFFIQFYALQGLFGRVRKAGRISPGLVKRKSACVEWDFQRQLILQEGLGKDPTVLLEQYRLLLRKIAVNIEESKARDDRRGIQIIPDYADHHFQAVENPFVRQFYQEVEQIEEEIADLSAG